MDLSIIGIIGIIIAIIIFIVGALKSVPYFILTVGVTGIVMLTNGIPVWPAITEAFIPGMHSAITAFFMLVLAATFYSNMMERTGTTQAVAYYCLDKFGRNNAVIVLMIISGLLGICGLNTIMMTFAMFSIIMTIFRETNTPRAMAPAFLFFGGSTFSTFIPASVNSMNVLPTQYLGTSLTCAPIAGLVCGVFEIVLCYLYLTWTANGYRKRKIGWVEPEGTAEVRILSEEEKKNLPPIGKAVIPLMILILFVLIASRNGLNSTMTAVAAMCIAAVVCGLLNIDKLKNDFNIGEYFQKTYVTTITAILPIMAVMGFGRVVSSSVGYEKILDILIAAPLSPYWKAFTGVAVIAGITGSGSTGIMLTLDSLGQYLVNSGANLDIIHRICATASTSLDTLPTCSAIFMVTSIYGVTHKEAYKHIFFVSVLFTGLIAAVLALYGTFVFPV